MKQYESERDLEAEITANIENIESFYGLNSVDSLKKLVEIIIDPRKSEQLFRQRSVTVSSIFTQPKDSGEINPDHIKLFSQKYSYEKLVEKYPRPKGETNRMLTCILQKKMSKQPITSHQTRKNIWLLVSGARFSMNHHKGLYQQLLNYEGYPDYFMRAIRQDINRTVSKSLTSEEELKSLSNILIAFSRRNPYVGYCQGLNFVAYFLLTMQFTEEEAFWLLSQIIQTVIPMDYYTNMIGVVCDQQVFLSILGNICPQIVAKFDDVGLDPSVLSIQWFVCLFTSSLPFYLVKIVWDRLLVEGPRAFIKAGVIILSHFENQILEVSEFHEIILLLERGTKQLTIPQAEFNAQFENIFISRQGLVLARTLYRQYHVKQKLSEKLNTKKVATECIECDPKWPICLVALEKNRRAREEIDVWIFRESKPIKIDHQYLLRQKENFVKTKSGSSDRKSKRDHIISPNFHDFMKLKAIPEERQSHIETERADNMSLAISFTKEKTEICDVYTRNDKNDKEQDFRSLIIGRMDHICQDKKNVEGSKKEVKNHKSMIMMEEQEQNEELKKQNYKKFSNLFDSPMEEESLTEEEMLRRSQTIKFFSQFVSDNLELSQIIVPSTKIS